MDFNILSTIIFLPLVGALFIIMFVRRGKTEANQQSARNSAFNLALLTSIATFLVSLLLLVDFNKASGEFQYQEQLSWLSEIGISYHLGIDGISLVFILLTTLLFPICVLISRNSITHYTREYMVAFLLLEMFVIGVFASLDFMLFYIFFEGSLIPMFLIIGIWGGVNRVYAAFKFFLYTLLGSVLLLVAMLYLYFQFGTTDIVALIDKAPELSSKVQMWLWLAFFASFAVKVPMFPFHTWLPDAHVQAPTAGSVILAGILLKLGAYGFLRFSLPMLPDASAYFSDFVMILSIVALIYTSLVALMQTDMKKMIAYSSVAHMGYVTAGIFAFNQHAAEGAIFQMISHGLVSGALFMCVGVLYDRMHTKEIAKFGGVTNVMPKFALIFMLFTMASVGLPMTSGFVGEFLVMQGVFVSSSLYAMLLATGLVLGAAYMLWLYKRVMFGNAESEEVKSMPDVSRLEILAFLPLIILTILFGLAPNLILDYLHIPVMQLIGPLS